MTQPVDRYLLAPALLITAVLVARTWLAEPRRRHRVQSLGAGTIFLLVVGTAAILAALGALVAHAGFPRGVAVAPAVVLGGGLMAVVYLWVSAVFGGRR